MAEFFDSLAAVCAPEIAAALKNKDADRAGAMIEGLATLLGYTIARAAGGDAGEIERILIGCEQHIAAEAAGFAGIINPAATLRTRRGG